MGVKGLAVVYEIAFDKHCSDPKRSGVIATTGFPHSALRARVGAPER